MSSASGDSQYEGWLEDTEEFKLICEICDLGCNRLKQYQSRSARRTSSRKNHRRKLNFELRKALTRPADLKLVIDLDWADDDEDIDDARQTLVDLCNVLERLSTQIDQEPPGGSARYIKLSALLERLKGSVTNYEVISKPGDPSALFWYPSESELVQTLNVVSRFNTFLDQLERSIADPSELAGVSVMKDTPSVIQDTASNPQNRTASFRSHPEFPPARPESQFRHVRTALRAMLSRLSSCRHREATTHRLLVQLPTLDQITSRDNCTSNNSLQLFISTYSDSSQWQEAKVTCIDNVAKPPIVDSGLSICDAINEALCWNGGLHFHIPRGLTNMTENDLIIPVYNYVDPERSQLKPVKSLRDLLQAGALGRIMSMERLRDSTIVKVPLPNANERRSLAIQILFGIVLCLRYDCNMASWDSRRVFILTGADGPHYLNMPPYVSVVERQPGASWLDLPDPQSILQKPQISCLTFTKIAKALLEIGFGQCLDSHCIDTNGNNEELWKDLRSIIHNFKTNYTTGTLDVLDTLPYITAADLCLRFTLLYRTEVSRSTRHLTPEEENPWEIVENIVTDQIIPELMQKGSAEPEIISMDSVIQERGSATRLPAVERRSKAHQPMSRPDLRPSQRKVVTLFDSPSQSSDDSTRINLAEDFFVSVENFRDSFESFLSRMGDQRNTPFRIAILDTGINKKSVQIDFDGTHMKDEWCVNFIDNGGIVDDDDGHGTYCASLIRKVAPNAEIYVAKVFSHNEFDLKEAENISKAIRHATEKWKAHVISMSFGLELPSSAADMPTWRRIRAEIVSAIDSAHPRLFFAAAANQGKNHPRAFPSTHRSVFCVHASDGRGHDFGINPGHENDTNNIMTLGAGISLYSDQEDRIIQKEGTSFATAIAAGMVADILDLTSRASKLNERSKAALRTNEGMRVLLQCMSGSDKGQPRPYVVPWNYWRPEVWSANPDRLDAIWAELNSRFCQFDYR